MRKFIDIIKRKTRVIKPVSSIEYGYLQTKERLKRDAAWRANVPLDTVTQWYLDSAPVDETCADLNATLCVNTIPTLPAIRIPKEMS